MAAGPSSAPGQTLLIDFGALATSSPDTNGYVWNNYTTTGTTLTNLVSSQNTGSGYGLEFVGPATLNTFSPVVFPNAGFGLFNVSNAVADGMFISGAVGTTNTLKLTSLNAFETYDFILYGGRDATATRSTAYTVAGSNTVTGTVTTSGTGVGGTGTNYNVTPLTLRGVTPSGGGEIFVNYAVATGTFAYLNALQVIGYVPYTNGSTTLSAAKPYQGNTLISGGASVTANAAGALGGGASILEIGAGGGTLTLGVSQTNAALLGSGNLALNTGTNVLYLAGGSGTLSSYYSAGSNTAARYSGVLSGGGILSKTGTNNLRLAGANTFGGTVQLAAGTLTLEHTNALQNATLDTTGAASRALVLAAGTNRIAVLNGNLAVTLGSSYLQLGAGAYTGALSGNGGILKTGPGVLTLAAGNSFTGGVVLAGGTLGIYEGNSLGAAISPGTRFAADSTLRFEQSPLGNVSGLRVFNIDAGVTATLDTQTNNATVDSVFAGAGGHLQKAGAGRLTLNGTSTYGGNTTVSAGTLVVNGSLAASAGVTVLSGATLGGTGLVAATFLDDGARLAPGNSPGILRVTNDLTLSGGSQLDFEIGAITNARSYYDAVVVNGTLTLDGVLNISNWAGGFGATPGTNQYALFDYTPGPGNLTDNGVVLGSVVTNLAYKVDTAVAGQVSLVVKEFNTAASFASNTVSPTLTLNFGTNTQTAGSNGLAFAIFNADLVDLMLGLDLTNYTAASGPFSVGGGLFSSLRAGSNQAFTAWMDLGTAGVYSNVLTFQLGSATSGFLLAGVTPDQTLTLILQGEVVAIPEPGSMVALLAVAGSLMTRRRR